jgi:diguanylate cyclase (GGDEF)-like protein
MAWRGRLWPQLMAGLMAGAVVHGVGTALDLAGRLGVWVGAVDRIGLCQLPFSLLAAALTIVALSLVRQKQELTARTAAEREVHDLVGRDPLTGLANRRELMRCLADGLAVSAAVREGLALVLIDLDQFRDVNDAFGHEAGDRLLIEAAARLVGGVRGGDTVARVDGDEFAVIVPAIGQRADADRVAGRLLQRLCLPYDHIADAIHLGGSAGLSWFPQDGTTPEQLLEHAELALRRAKEDGYGHYQVFDHGMKARIEHRVRLERELRKALARDELELFYQPLVDFGSGRASAVEALVRWHHPERGLMAPSEFLPVAEASGLIVPLSGWVLRTACATMASWRDRGFAPLRLAVNLSAAQFGDTDLVATIERALAESGLDPEALELEITENIIIERAGSGVLEALRQLRDKGVGLAFDDFGTGYSSLVHLRQVPVDRVKIDRSFIHDMLEDPDDAAIVRAVIHLAKSLGLRVVAEGIDHPGHVEALLAEGCDEGQGYLFSPPRPAAELPDLLGKPFALSELPLVS